MPALAGIVGVLLGAGAMMGRNGLAWRETDTRGRTEGIVHAYLLDHPEVIQEANQRLQDRETGRLIAASRPAIETPVGDAFAGNPKGDVSVVEYYDYNCGFCRASLPTIAQLVRAEPSVRVVYRELPVLAQSSLVAARASLLAAGQGRFRRFHDGLYAAGPVTDATIAAASRLAGVDTSRAAAERPGEDAAIRANLDVARHLGMAGTPAWVVGDRVLVGAQTLDQLRAAVAAARAARGAAA